MARVNAPGSRLSPAPPAPGTMRVAKPVQRIGALQPEPRRDPGQLYSPKVPAEYAEVMQAMAKAVR